MCEQDKCTPESWKETAKKPKISKSFEQPLKRVAETTGEQPQLAFAERMPEASTADLNFDNLFWQDAFLINLPDHTPLLSIKPSG